MFSRPWTAIERQRFPPSLVASWPILLTANRPLRCRRDMH